MEAPTDVIDSTEPWVKNQIDEYVATNGEKPVFRHGAPLVLVTYKGRKTGQWRRTCLIGAEYEGSYLLVASKGGADDDPAWYPNLVEHPEAWLQVGPNYFPVTARTATRDEKPPRWDYMVTLWPDYANYQTKTDRDIPVVILDPIPVVD
jgi:deazaflavin-dependent oxidoreductase (nitroreductase family)